MLQSMFTAYCAAALAIISYAMIAADCEEEPYSFRDYVSLAAAATFWPVVWLMVIFSAARELLRAVKFL